MSICNECGGKGVIYTQARCPCGCDGDERECEACGGVGLGPCLECGKQTKSGRAAYCSEECYTKAGEVGP